MNPLLALIRRHESDGAVRLQSAMSAYDVVWGGIPKSDRPVMLTGMTVGQVLDWQDDVVRKGSASSAAGAYQIIRKTLRGLIEMQACHINDDFNPATQDACAMALLRGRGLNDWRAGKITDEQFGDRLAMEWASLPVITGPNRGRSYYAGDGLNKASASPDEVMAALRQCRMPEPVTPLPPVQPQTWVDVLLRILARIFGGRK